MGRGGCSWCRGLEGGGGETGTAVFEHLCVFFGGGDCCTGRLNARHVVGHQLLCLFFCCARSNIVCASSPLVLCLCPCRIVLSGMGLMSSNTAKAGFVSLLGLLKLVSQTLCVGGGGGMGVGGVGGGGGMGGGGYQSR